MSEPMQFRAPTPLEYFATLVADDASLSLIEAAVAIAQVEFPDLDTQAVLGDIDALADRLKRRIPADAVPLQRLRWLNRFFFQEVGFAGNVNDYYDPANSYLHAVLRTRRGIPITLAVLYVELATHIGLPAHGVSFPGHFLVKLRLQGGSQQGEVVIDPFTGQSLSREELDELVAPYKRSHGLTGDFAVPPGLSLQSAPPRAVLGRMLRNLKEIHRAAGDWLRLVAVLDRMVVLLPQAWEERRDRGLALAELGHDALALDDIGAYLTHRRQAEAPPGRAERAAELRRPGRRQLH